MKEVPGSSFSLASGQSAVILDPRPVCRGAAVILVQGVLLSLTALSVGALKIFPFKLQTNTVHGIFVVVGERLTRHQTAGASSGRILPAFSARPSGRGDGLSGWFRDGGILGAFRDGAFRVGSPPRNPHPAAFRVGIHLPNPGRRF